MLAAGRPRHALQQRHCVCHIARQVRGRVHVQVPLLHVSHNLTQMHSNSTCGIPVASKHAGVRAVIHRSQQGLGLKHLHQDLQQPIACQGLHETSQDAVTRQKHQWSNLLTEVVLLSTGLDLKVRVTVLSMSFMGVPVTPFSRYFTRYAGSSALYIATQWLSHRRHYAT